jgi:hypothetical protein
MARFDRTRVSLSKGNGATLVHQRLELEGGPDRRLSSAVACMVMIKKFGATGRGAGSFSTDASDWVPKLGKSVKAFGQHAGRGGASVGTGFWTPPSSTFLRVLRTAGSSIGGIQPPKRPGYHAGGQLRDFQGQAPEFGGLWRTPWRCHRSGSRFGWPIGASRATKSSSARRRESSTWGGEYTRKREAGVGGEMEGR